ncbi:winged helix DNA-binding domain-containing protein [Corynebacterium sp. H128]|uniref:winged helix DNA-binding domain-containing protein n=1 Tax=Corynebacterium sp. H128 TaxID=3133427 RepID=UPI0030B311AE
MDFPALRARRIYAQKLLHPMETATQAARWMLATQGQQYGSGITAIEVRSAEPVAAAVEKQMIVRTWSQRGTHHFLAAEDAQWMMRLCGPRPEAAAAKRRPGLGITPEFYQSCYRDFLAALGDGPVSRSEAYGIFGADGTVGGHLLRSFGGLGEIVQGARRGKEDVFMLVSALPVASRELDSDEALTELGTRYFHSRGPATVQDLAWWSGLTVRDAKRAAALARDVIAVGNYFMGAFQEEWSDFEAALSLQLSLPAFDEYLLGYGDRAAVCAPELVPIVGPTRNRICRPFTVSRGEVVAET